MRTPRYWVVVDAMRAKFHAILLKSRIILYLPSPPIFCSQAWGWPQHIPEWIPLKLCKVRMPRHWFIVQAVVVAINMNSTSADEHLCKWMDLLNPRNHKGVNCDYGEGLACSFLWGEWDAIVVHITFESLTDRGKERFNLDSDVMCLACTAPSLATSAAASATPYSTYNCNC
jgi:hypothetical protein